MSSEANTFEQFLALLDHGDFLAELREELRENIIGLRQHKLDHGGEPKLGLSLKLGLTLGKGDALMLKASKEWAEVKFSLSLYEPERTLERAVDEAAALVGEKVGIPMLDGSPEAESGGRSIG